MTKKRKSLLTWSAAICLATGLGFGLSACGEKQTQTENVLSMQDVYAKAQELGFQGTLDELISMFKGEKGDDGTQGEKGEKGEKGDDGLDGAGIASVRIDENGLLVITLTDGTKLPGVDLSAATGQTQAESNLHFMLSPTKDSYAVVGIGMEESSEVVIPSTYKGLPVTLIRESAFRVCSGLTSVTIPDSVTEIRSSAFFGCSGLTSVYYGGTIDEWVQIAFYSESDPLCYAKKLYINNELVTEANLTTATKISDYAFDGYDSLTSVTIPDSVTSIGDWAFSGCRELASVPIGSGVTEIGDYAFYDCYKLAEVINKSNLNITKGSSSYGYVGYYALTIHNGESKIVDKDGYLFITGDDGKNYLLGYTGTALTLPNDYNGENYQIYNRAFYNCSGLTSVTIPDSVTSIGDWAFHNCSGLTSVTIPDSVTLIGDWAFYNCSGLTSVTIPDSVIGIGDYAFRDCSGLTSVTIGSGVTSIGNGAFNGCNSLEAVYYQGTERDWNEIYIEYYNNYAFRSATRYYYRETKPTATGNYWHYVNGEIVIWK